MYGRSKKIFILWFKKILNFSVLAQFVIQLRALKRQQNCCSFMYIYIYDSILSVSWKLWLFAIECNSISCFDKIHLKIYYFHNIIPIINAYIRLHLCIISCQLPFERHGENFEVFFFLIECMHAGVHNLLII